MKCPNCGKNLSDDSKFCTKCGTPLRMQAPGNRGGGPVPGPAGGPGRPGGAPGNMPGRPASGPGGAMPGRPASGPGSYQNYPPYGAPEPPKKKKGFLLPLLIILLLAAVGGAAVFAVKHFRGTADSDARAEADKDSGRKKDRKDKDEQDTTDESEKETARDKDDGKDAAGAAEESEAEGESAAKGAGAGLAAETTAASGTAAGTGAATTAALATTAAQETTAAAITTSPVPYHISLYMPDYVNPGRIIPVKRAKVSASSMLSETGYDHSVYMAFDGLLESSWQDGGNRETGEYIEVAFDTPETFDTIAIWAGNFRTEALHFKNNIPTKLLMEADGVEYHLTLDPAMAANVVEFSSPVTSQHIRFTVEDYQRGSAYTDTSIADITFSNSAAAPNGMKPDWVQEAEGWAYFDRNGERLFGWHTLNGTNYYFTPDGIMGTDWQLVGKNWYYMGDDGIPRTGPQTINGAQYYFQDDGIMMHDTRSPAGYYLGSDGKRR